MRRVQLLPPGDPAPAHEEAFAAMPGAHAFLVALTVTLGVAGVTTVVCQRLHQPVVLGYILAGLIVGPHVPLPLVADVGIIQTLSEAGVILLMFAIGLDFRLGNLLRVGPAAGLTAMIECSIVFWLGVVVGRLLGWSTLEAIFAGAVVSISSTTIVTKSFGELGIRGTLRELVVAVLVVEDLIAILLLTILTAVARGSGLSARDVVSTVGQLALFLAMLLAGGIVLVPRTIRWIRRLDRPETTLVASLGLCFGAALLAQRFGYSVALGAFIAGSLVAESGEERYVERLVQPVRDMFAAIFFVSVGMLIDPAMLVVHWSAVLALTALVILGKALSVAFGAFLTGHGNRTSVEAGMSLGQIGEFSFIIAGLGLSLGVVRPFLYPVAVAVSAITSLTTPWLIRAADAVSSYVDRKLPRPIQTLSALYGSWLEGLRSAPDAGRVTGEVRRIARALALDAVVITTVVIGAALGRERGAAALRERLGVGADVAHWTVIVAAALVCLPFCAGVLRNARRMGLMLAAAALPERGSGQIDLAAAPRRALVVTLQLTALTLVAVPVIAVTQPFLPGTPGAAVIAGIAVLLGISFWRGATNLQGHVRAGAQLIIEALARQAPATARDERDALAHVREILPGIGEPVPVRIERTSPAVGRSLAELHLRGVTGATVLAIWRPASGAVVPGPTEMLQPGDVLALAGTRDAVAAARALLNGTQPEHTPGQLAP